MDSLRGPVVFYPSHRRVFHVKIVRVIVVFLLPLVVVVGVDLDSCNLVLDPHKVVSESELNLLHYGVGW